MAGKKKLHTGLLFLLLGALAFSACNAGEESKGPESGNSGTTLTVFPTVTPGGVIEGEFTTGDLVEETVDAGQQTVTPEPTPTRIIPEDIVDTLEEPYTYEEMTEDLELLALAYPDIVTVTTEGYSADGRAIPAVRFGNPAAEQVVFVQAAIHGREHLTALLVMEQLETYAKNYDTGVYGGKTYREIFSEVALVVVPMSNPDGVSISQLGTESIRSEELRALVESFYERDGSGVTREYFYKRYKANANGVDLNRNFAYGWEEFGGASAPAADRYKGVAPGSEPETQVLMCLTEREPVAAALSYHATGSVLYWDFGQTGDIREECLSYVETVHELTGYRIVYADSEKQDEAGYCEWAVGIKGIPEVTIEIGTVSAPLPISEFAGVWERNKNVPVAVAAQVLQGLGETTE
ncbi:MAG: peptidase [Lachnospiraceae bacterium]|nr:peptidase [Lachnospiraceae bacterium]